MQPLVILTRSDHIESIHHGHICIINSNNQLIANIGKPSTKMFLRSSAKPFQALAAVYTGAIDHYNISDEELAVICASHSGEEIHRRTVKSILKKIGVAETDLDCGVANPYNKDTNEWLIRNEKKPTKLYNCCSGKHAGMLMLCKFYDYPVKGYVERNHPVQRLILGMLAEILKCSVNEIILGDDGCGVPNCLITVQQAAYLYALLAGGASRDKYDPAFQRIRKAIVDNPRMISGDGEFCTDLIQHAKGKVIGKVGGEGVYGISVIEKQLGICIKVLDGNERAVYPIAIHVLRQLGILDDEAFIHLHKWAFPLVKDHKGKTVGYTVPVFDLQTDSQNRAISIGEEYHFAGE